MTGQPAGATFLPDIKDVQTAFRISSSYFNESPADPMKCKTGQTFPFRFSIAQRIGDV